MFCEYYIEINQKGGEVMKLDGFTTERRNPNTIHLDNMSALEIVSVMNEEDKKVPVAIEENLEKIAEVSQLVAEAFTKGGRLIYIGAGTSGRLGVLDASECVPTFGVPASQVVGIIAGGDIALRHAVEGAEDSKTLPIEDLKNIGLSDIDVVIGLAASGRTPYVIAGLEYAAEVGAKTVAISCNKGSKIGEAARIAIEVEVGPEVLTGSTRLKSGTAQKLVLNMITTTSMVLSGKAYENLMVDVQMSNEKLEVRAENIVMEATGVDRESVRATIDEAQGQVKTAIVMILTDKNYEEAKSLLDQNGGHVRATINDKGGKKG